MKGSRWTMEGEAIRFYCGVSEQYSFHPALSSPGAALAHAAPATHLTVVIKNQKRFSLLVAKE